tara:strand:- start:2265 stop:3752 length:1488 start_codon:yes stop_codon:yes gene_type:complete
MDEEEYQEEEQSNSKINLGSFFERVDSVEKVASSALSKANANFGIINVQKTLINTLNVSIEALETKVRDIANYIIIEKKITRDEEADRLVEERDKEQKNITAERLMGLKGDQGVQGEPGEPAPAPEEGGGNPLMSFLKGIAALGIAGFAVTYLWPALLPLIGPLLGKLGLGLMVGSGALLGGFLGAQLLKVPLVGKKMGPAVEKGIEDNFTKVGEGIQKATENIGKDGKLEIPNLGGGEGEGGAEESNLKFDDSMTDTLKDKDLVPAESFSEYRNRTGNVDSEEEKDGKKIMMTQYTKKTKSGTGKSSTQVKVKKGGRLDSLTKGEIVDLYAELHKRYNGDGEELNFQEEKDYEHYLPELMWAKYGLYSGDIESFLAGGEADPFITNRLKPKNLEVESNIQNKDVDLSLYNSFTEDIGMDDSQFLGELINVDPTGNLNNSQNKGQVVNTPYNLPNTTETIVKFTDMKVPFLKSLSNQYLSISGKTIPPEYYRAFK